MKAMVLHAINDFRCEEIETPTPKGDEILVKIGACGICGSDIPRVYELGTRVYPVVTGHEFAGEVVAVGNEKDKDVIGKKVAVFPLIPCRNCDPCEIGNYCQCQNYGYLGSRNNGGFAQYCLVPSRWHLVEAQNQDINLEELCMTEPACVAQHALRRGGVNAGQTVLIFGAGPIGIMMARWAKLFGAKEVVMVDIDDVKVKFAEDRGFTVINSIKEDVVARVNEMTNGRGMDVVVEGTGSSAGLNNAIQCTRIGGNLVWMGNPHTDTKIELANHSLILRKELNMLGIWNSSYSETPINEWKYTVQMISEGKLEVGDLITHKAGIEGMKKLFDQIYDHEIVICKAIYSAALDNE